MRLDCGVLFNWPGIRLASYDLDLSDLGHSANNQNSDAISLALDKHFSNGLAMVPHGHKFASIRRFSSDLANIDDVVSDRRGLALSIVKV